MLSKVHKINNRYIKHKIALNQYCIIKKSLVIEPYVCSKVIMLILNPYMVLFFDLGNYIDSYLFSSTVRYFTINSHQHQSNWPRFYSSICALLVTTSLEKRNIINFTSGSVVSKVIRHVGIRSDSPVVNKAEASEPFIWFGYTGRKYTFMID